MTDDQRGYAETGEIQSMYCPRCGGAMQVAPQHVQGQVACPHCDYVLEPWRVLAGGAGVPATQSGPALQGIGGYSWRNRWIAGILGIVLGGFGVHRFYLGFTGMGVIQIVVTVLTCGVGSVWGLIEGILCLAGAMRDVDGLPLRE